MRLYFLIFVMMLFPMMVHAYPDIRYKNNTVNNSNDITWKNNIPTLTFRGKVNGSSASKIVRELRYLKNIGVKKIIIDMDSPGGETASGYFIISVMKDLQQSGIKIEIDVKETSHCMSMCTVIFAYADIRKAHELSLWMFHSPFKMVDNVLLTDENTEKRIDIERQKTIIAYSRVSPSLVRFLIKNEHIYVYNKPFYAIAFTLHSNFSGWITDIYYE